MPKNGKITKVLVIGSGPIVIGQAAEFDYAGTQACIALKEEGCKIVLINNNPATIMTDEKFADAVYFEPLTIASIKKIIEKEKPDGLLPTVGGQTGLNLALELDRQGVLDENQITVLGTPIDSIMQGEDREKFRALMNELQEPVPESEIVANLDEALRFAEKIGYPLIVRPAYTLGGSGGGFATNKVELENYVKRGLKLSPIQQCLIEKSIAGFKEIEYEVIRDANDTCNIVCAMENLDPVGIHTGDSIVVAPDQTLTRDESSMLRNAAVKIVRALGIVGACNVQLAMDPDSSNYFVIEVNARVSRSSALASKATGYPIARIATKIGLGYHLHELPNPLSDYKQKTGSVIKTTDYKASDNASTEPNIDYIVVKFPRWPFDTFSKADRRLGTQMKATGEVMAIEENLESALQKAVRSLEVETKGLVLAELKSFSTEQLMWLAIHADDRRFFVLLELMRRGESVESLQEATKINKFFLDCMYHLVKLEEKAEQLNLSNVTKSQLLELKQHGFSDEWLANAWDMPTESLRKVRNSFGIHPVYGKIGSSTGEQSYYYSRWRGENTLEKTSNKKILIVGSGPIRIGQGIEFDYCSVHGVLALKKYGYETILINNNPETVSTDYEIADRLYFDPLTVEDVLHVVEFEQVDGVIVQFGGQTAISLVKGLEEAGVNLLGSTLHTIDELEDRDRFYQLIKKLQLPHIPGLTATSKQDLKEKAVNIGFPVLLRPSYVIGGKGMVVLKTESELESYTGNINSTLHFPILIDAYYPGKEVEVDVVTDGNEIIIPGIFEHIEKAGVHSGDSMAVTPPFTLSEQMKKQIGAYASTIAKNMDFRGIFNIQFVIDRDELFVLEVNPRASRTVPILSKMTGVNMIELATGALIGKSLSSMSRELGLLPENDFYTIKSPIFSTGKLPGLDPLLGPEMQSTGEIIAISDTFEKGLDKAFLWNEQQAASYVNAREIYFDSSIMNLEKLSEKMQALGFTCVQECDFTDDVSFEKWLKTGKVFAIISNSSNSQKRELALQYEVLVMSSEETAGVFAAMKMGELEVFSIQHWKKAHQKEVVVQ